jgi:hypothetical protein
MNLERLGRLRPDVITIHRRLMEFSGVCDFVVQMSTQRQSKDKPPQTVDALDIDDKVFQAPRVSLEAHRSNASTSMDFS